jgi:hypothetical protein
VKENKHAQITGVIALQEWEFPASIPGTVKRPSYRGVHRRNGDEVCSRAADDA